MFTWAAADRSDRDGDMNVGGWRADEEGKEKRGGQTDRQTEMSDICSRQLTTPG